MKKMQWVSLGALVLILVGAVACQSDEGYSDGAQGGCGQGQQVAQSCVYESSLIIEGFQCPPELAFRHDFDGFLVCVADQELPDGLRDDLGDAGFTPRELPAADPGQGCEQPGARVDAADGCNTCECDQGAWSCTEIDCAQGNNQAGLSCGDGGTFDADDGCNTCQCDQEGDRVSVACTEIGCPQQCEPGDTFEAEDGCSCQCGDTGHWLCNPVGCMQTVCEEGVTLPAGDGCNTCQCLSGVWSCTRLACQ